MATIINVSQSNDVYGTVWASRPKPDPTVPAWSLAPGKKMTVVYPGGKELPCYHYFFPQPKSVPNQTPYYQGYLRQSYEVDVNPDNKTVKIIGQYLTERDLLKYKSLHPNDEKIQAVTLAELQAKYKPDQFRGNGAKKRSVTDEVFARDTGITDCQWASAIVVIDCIFALTGAYGLASKVSQRATQNVAHLIAPVMNELEESIHILATSDSKLAKAGAIKNIVHVIWSGSLIEAVYHAIMESLTWWDMIIYGVLGIATIAAAFLTDGAALVAMFVAELALLAFIVSDSVKAVQACSITS